MKKEKDVNQINPYELDKLSKIPSWLIVILLKYWAAAAAVYFGLIGGISIGLDFSNWNDPTSIAEKLAQDEIVILILAFALCIVMNYIVKPIVRLMYNRRNNTYRYNMVNGKGFVFLFVTFFYTFILSIILYVITNLLSYYGLVLDLFGTTGSIGIDPFTYALCFLAVDSIFVLASLYSSSTSSLKSLGLISAAVLTCGNKSFNNPVAIRLTASTSRVSEFASYSNNSSTTAR